MVFPYPLLATVAGAFISPPIVIDAPVVDCPNATAVGRSLAAVIPRDADDVSRLAWKLSLQPLASGPSEASAVQLRVTLNRPTGETALTRILASADRRCDSAADAIALIVERYFRSLDWTASTPAPAPAVLQPSSASHEHLTRPGETGPSSVFGPRVPRLQLSAGMAAWNRGTQRLVAQVELRARIVGRISVAAGALLPPSSQVETLPASDRLHLQMWPVLARVMGNGATRLVAWWGGLDGLIAFERADPDPGLANPTTRRRVVFAPGAVVGAEVSLSARWRLGLEVAGYRTLLGNSLLVGTSSTPAAATKVMEPPAWQGLAALRVGWLILQ